MPLPSSMPAKKVIRDISTMVMMGALLMVARPLEMMVMPPSIWMACANTAAPIRMLTTLAKELPMAFRITVKSLVTSLRFLRRISSSTNTKTIPIRLAVGTSSLMVGTKLNTVIRTRGITGRIA